MAEIKPTASVRPASSGQAKKSSSNAISWVAPILCILLGYIIWRFILGHPSGFEKSGPGWFWPERDDPKPSHPFAKMYLGGIVVPVLIGCFLTVVVFSVERLLTILRATGSGNTSEFVRKVQFHLANKDIDKAVAECDRQRGSVGNVMKAGLKKYREMITNTELTTDQKLMSIQKEVEEATALELPMLEKNLVFLSTLASVATLLGLFGTVLGMITAFSALGDKNAEAGGDTTKKLSVGISEALYNTALGIGTSAIAIIVYNIFTTKIDGITYGIDESGFTLQQSFASMYK